jgi:hypothetical protein
MTIIADLLVPFCDASSLNIRDCSKTVKKRFLISLSFVDAVALHKNLFGEQHYLDWDGMQDYLSEISFSVTEWWELLRLLDFVEEIASPQEVADLVASTLVGVKLSSAQTKKLNPIESLRVCYAKIKVQPSWDLLCKSFIACNLHDIDPFQMLQLVCAEEPKKKMDDQSIRDLVRYLASFKHTKKEYTDIFTDILNDSSCKVRTHVVIESIKAKEALKEMRKKNAIMSGIAFKKPSLTQLLERKLLSEGAAHPQDSFASFCRLSKIASNANLRLKQTAYFILCLPEITDEQRETIFSRIVGGDRIVLASMQKMHIHSPDVQELRRIILDTQYTSTPSDTLRDFRKECVANCLAMTKGLNWTTVMRLYMAAYCRPGISKDLWCHVVANSIGADVARPFLNTSSETETIVQGFVKAKPIDINEIVDTMLTDI